MVSLYSLKYWYTRRLGVIIQASVRRGISPDVWTAIGVIAAAGAGAARLNGGPFGKTERCLAAVVAAALPQYLAMIAWAIIVGSAVTACVRLARTAAALAGRTGPALADTMAPQPPQDITRIGRSALEDEVAPGAQS